MFSSNGGSALGYFAPTAREDPFIGWLGSTYHPNEVWNDAKDDREVLPQQCFLVRVDSLGVGQWRRTSHSWLVRIPVFFSRSEHQILCCAIGKVQSLLHARFASNWRHMGNGVLELGGGTASQQLPQVQRGFPGEGFVQGVCLSLYHRLAATTTV